KRGELLPVYVVAGEEQFIRDQVVAELRAAAIGGGVAAFNEDKFTAGEVDADKVIAAARTVPMMAPRRFVFVRAADRWDSDGAGEPHRDRSARSGGEPVTSTCLVLVAGKLDGRRKLAALAKKQDFLVACEPLEARALPRWIVDRARTRGHAIDGEVAELLAE